mmetsp:Transcript_5802/g.18265  ORF Transcript_5802/g.18265 Transcript_5802/m.18265 type:complete len:220 (-) Transcript_5802:883-1542(-)
MCSSIDHGALRSKGAVSVSGVACTRTRRNWPPPPAGWAWPPWSSMRRRSACSSAEDFLHWTICRKMWSRSARGSRLRGDRSFFVTPMISAPSQMKNSRFSRSLSLHLLVSIDRRDFSGANLSSRSKRSSDGGGSSRCVGSNVAGSRGGSGAWNSGWMSVRGSCFTPRCSCAATTSGMRCVSKRNIVVSNSCVKSRGSSSLSSTATRSRSARDAVSGRKW